MTVWYKESDALIHEIESSRPKEDEIYIWNIGQCGFIFKTEGMLFAVDPVLNDLPDRLTGLSKRLYPAGIDPDKLRLDAVFITHAHRDHMAVPTLQKLLTANPDLKLFVPSGLVQDLQDLGISENNIIPFFNGQKKTAGTLEIKGIRTAHPDYLNPASDQESNLAWLIEHNGMKILHLGDTYLCSELISSLEQEQPVNIFIPPINGSDYFRTARGCIGNLSPLEAAMTAHLVQADLSIPSHYDMMQGNTCSPYAFLQEMDVHHPKGKNALPKLGERLIYKKG